MKHVRMLGIGLFVLGAATAAQGAFISFEAGGNNTAASIQGTVDAFRAALGAPNNGNAPGPLGTGRREINWDGGGDATSPVGTPFNGFQNNRGASFNTPGTGFVQAPPTGGPGGGLATVFGNATYGTTFGTFSAQRLFSPVASNITDVTFFIPGTGGATQAGVSAFGAVFTDVDLANTTRIQFFNVNNVEIYNRTVLAGTVSDASLSFLGAQANAGEQIFRVRITTGNSALGPNDGGGIDVVAMDDFIYAEPQALIPIPPGAVPMPTSLAGGALLAAWMYLTRGRNSSRTS